MAASKPVVCEPTKTHGDHDRCRVPDRLLRSDPRGLGKRKNGIRVQVDLVPKQLRAGGSDGDDESGDRDDKQDDGESDDCPLETEVDEAREERRRGGCGVACCCLGRHDVRCTDSVRLPESVRHRRRVLRSPVGNRREVDDLAVVAAAVVAEIRDVGGYDSGVVADAGEKTPDSVDVIGGYLRAL